MSMRKATLDDLDQIFKMVWDNVDAFATGIPDPAITREYLRLLILETFDDGVWCDNDCTAAMGYSLAFDGFSRAKNCYGLFLVSTGRGTGLRLAKEVFEWVKAQDYKAHLMASPKMINFYTRIGMRPKDIVFTE